LNEVIPRLTRCFATVFPDLDENNIALCSQKTVGAWDSVAAITLVNVIEEEFSISIDLELLPELDSFRAIAEYLEKQPT
jgi:acyl carrier protein